MRGIADGANAAGAKWLGRKIDLIDIVLANTTIETGTLASAMSKTQEWTAHAFIRITHFWHSDNKMAVKAACPRLGGAVSLPAI
jgi:hypothetical protein